MVLRTLSVLFRLLEAGGKGDAERRNFGRNWPPLRELPKSAGDQITGYERGVNNRAFNFCGDALVEAMNHPDNPLANDYQEICGDVLARLG